MIYGPVLKKNNSKLRPNCRTENLEFVDIKKYHLETLSENWAKYQNSNFKIHDVIHSKNLF